MRVSEKVVRTIDQRLLFNILEEKKKQTQLLGRIADVLDTMALEQDSLHGTVEGIANSVAPEEIIPSITNIPGFPEDPLEGFPSIRKDRDNG